MIEGANPKDRALQIAVMLRYRGIVPKAMGNDPVLLALAKDYTSESVLRAAGKLARTCGDSITVEMIDKAIREAA